MIMSTFLAAGLLLIVGCSSGPSSDDMAHLNTLKQQVVSLKKEVAEKQSAKSSLEQQLAAKKQALAQAVQDENETKANLAKYK